MFTALVSEKTRVSHIGRELENGQEEEGGGGREKEEEEEEEQGGWCKLKTDV